MQIEKLDHVNVRTTQLDVMIAWYTDVLGLNSGPRPDFGFPGAWMYAGETAVVHLVTVEGTTLTGSEAALRLEHFAFSAKDGAAFEARLKAKGEEYRRSDVPGIELVQFNVWDPDGNHIHIDFAASDTLST